MPGIENLGSTCYINAVLQGLFHCEGFVNFLKTYQHNQLVGLLYELCICSKKVAHPGEFLSELQKKFPLILRQQNDICEFITLFIDCLNGEVKKEQIEPVKVAKTAETMKELTCLLAYEWSFAHYKEYSPLKDMFYGQLISQIRCIHCDKISHNYEIFMHLSLPIQKNTLDGCLYDYFALEEIPEWKCDKCNKTQVAQLATRLWRLPQILIITYKRFTNNLQKITTKVATPYTLNLTPYVIGPVNHSYVLKAAAYHIGGPMNGHYFAVCKNETWIVYDDENIRVTQETKLNPDEAYMLFYERI